MDWTRWIETLWQDFRYAGRMLRKTPRVTSLAVLTLALGIGINTASFSIVNAVLLNPLPYPEPDHLVALHSRTPSRERTFSSYPNFLDWVRDSRAFSDLAALRRDELNLTGLGQPERVPAMMVSASLFRLMGVQPVLGRAFLPTDDQLGAAPVALISERFWKQKFGSSPAALGKSLLLSGTSYVIVGVIPATYRYEVGQADRTDLYLPIGAWDAPGFRDRQVSMSMDIVGRLKPGVSLEQASAEMDAIARHLAEQYPAVNKGLGITVVPLESEVVGPVKPLLLLLATAVLFVLLIAGVNVANLLLARSSRRAADVAIRAALGASRTRIVRQFLIESVLLALAGGGLGALLAFWGTEAALAALPDVLLPRADTIRVDQRVLVFTTTVSVAAGVLFGLVPAIKASRLDLRPGLTDRGPRAGGGHHRTQRVFVVLEIALAFVLSVGAGLMIRSLATVLSMDPGFKTDHLAVARVSFPGSVTTPSHMMAVWRQMSETFQSLPGVRGAALSASSVPMTGQFSTLPFWLEGEAKPATMAEMRWAVSFVVDPEYREVMEIPVRRGRFLSERDNEHASAVMVIDDQFAKRHFPNQDPVGRRIHIDVLDMTVEVVGVVGHVRQSGLDETEASPDQAQCYLSMFQLPAKVMPMARDVAIVLRTADAPMAQVAPVRRALEQINGQLVMYREQAMDDIIADGLATRRFSMIVLGLFAALSLVMACIGIYGVMWHWVGERRREIATRLALGATQRDVVLMVFRDGVMMTLLGVAIGLGAALGLTRLISSLLFGISAQDPLTVAGVLGVLMAVALAACLIPARSATRIDPMIALRTE